MLNVVGGARNRRVKLPDEARETNGNHMTPAAERHFAKRLRRNLAVRHDHTWIGKRRESESHR
jgi:hypothetical protein